MALSSFINLEGRCKIVVHVFSHVAAGWLVLTSDCVCDQLFVRRCQLVCNASQCKGNMAHSLHQLTQSTQIQISMGLSTEPSGCRHQSLMLV